MPGHSVKLSDRRRKIFYIFIVAVIFSVFTRLLFLKTYNHMLLNGDAPGFINYALQMKNFYGYFAHRTFDGTFFCCLLDSVRVAFFRVGQSREILRQPRTRRYAGFSFTGRIFEKSVFR